MKKGGTPSKTAPTTTTTTTTTTASLTPPPLQQPPPQPKAKNTIKKKKKPTNKNKTNNNSSTTKSNDKTTTTKNTTTPTTVASSATSTTAIAQEDLYCVTCVEPIKFFAIGPCNHVELCSMCSLRLRQLYKDNQCPFCKAPVEDIVFTKNPHTKFQDIDKSKLSYDPNLHIYFDDADHQREVKNIMTISCKLCATPPFSTTKDLAKHMKVQHNKNYCELCLEDRKVFLYQQKLFSAEELKDHMAKGAVEEKPFTGHPPCGFCSVRFYGNDQLYDHLNKNHETCFLCNREGKQYQYYRNYETLEKHFDKDHFLCHHPACLEAKFKAFGTANELKAHEAECHFDKKLSKAEARQAYALDINITIARPGSGGGIVLAEDEPPPRREQSNRNRRSRPTTPTPSISSSSSASASSSSSSSATASSSSSSSSSASSSSSTSSSTSSRPTSPNPISVSSPPPQEITLAIPTSKQETDDRNKKLAGLVKAKLQDESKYRDFKQFSSSLLQRTITPAEYYAKFLLLFGETNFQEIFLELVALLPVPTIRDALVDIHKQHLAIKQRRKEKKEKKEKKDSKQTKKAQPPQQPQSQPQLQQPQPQSQLLSSRISSPPPNTLAERIATTSAPPPDTASFPPLAPTSRGPPTSLFPPLPSKQPPPMTTTPSEPSPARLDDFFDNAVVVKSKGRKQKKITLMHFG